VQKAIKRLPAKEAYDRTFRIRRAFQVRPTPSPISAHHESLTKPSIAVLYLPHSSPRC
jgi:ubiquinol-cytochrome c reductase subunit 7